MNYIVFVKILISFILGLVAMTACLLMAAAGEKFMAGVIAITGVMLLVWLWTGGKK